MLNARSRYSIAARTAGEEEPLRGGFFGGARRPQIYVEMYEKSLAGKTEEALGVQEASNRFVDLLDAMPFWTSTVKAALHLMGICGPTVAAPAPPLTVEETELLRSHLSRYHLL